MIERYSTDKMTALFSAESRFQYMTDVEVACVQVQAQMGIIPRSAARDIEKKVRFQVSRINEIEKTTKHDVIAFVSNLAENVGPNGKYIHFGLTSSDVLDTAMSLQLSDALNALMHDVLRLRKKMFKLATDHRQTVCAGRTHGIFAEITSFGFKMAGFAAELDRNIKRLVLAEKQIRICKLSGAVGTSSALSPAFEMKVAKKLNLQVEKFATQVVPRDRHAEVLMSLAFLAAGFERLALELRHLQRSEVSEVIEGFSKGQKGSSAMPHKKNPISAENLTGLSRLLRSYALAGLENIPLWHERDISHSSVERVVLPDAFQLAHYMTLRLTDLLEKIYIDTERMKKNTELLGGVLYSSHLLLHLVEKHQMSREKAYEIVQKMAHELEPGESLIKKIRSDRYLSELFDRKTLDEIFSGKRHMASVQQRMRLYLKGDLTK